MSQLLISALFAPLTRLCLAAKHLPAPPGSSSPETSSLSTEGPYTSSILHMLASCAGTLLKCIAGSGVDLDPRACSIVPKAFLEAVSSLPSTQLQSETMVAFSAILLPRISSAITRMAANVTELVDWFIVCLSWLDFDDNSPAVSTLSSCHMVTLVGQAAKLFSQTAMLDMDGRGTQQLLGQLDATHF